MSPYEAAVFALSPRVRAAGEEQLGSVEDVDEDGELGLDQRPEVVLEHGDDVLQELDDYPVHPRLQEQCCEKWGIFPIMGTFRSQSGEKIMGNSPY